MKIGIFADSHYSTMEVSNKTRRPSLSLSKIRQALEAFAGVDIIVCLGDLVDTCASYVESESKLREIGRLIRETGIPFYCLRGNHDCDLFTVEQFYAALGCDQPPFALKAGMKRLLFLDANFDSAGNAYRPGKVDWTDVALSSSQIDALKQALKEDDADEFFVFMHQNIDPDVQWQHILSNAEEIRAILAESGKVRKVIQGHYHPGHDNFIDGIVYHTLPAMCEGDRNHFEIIEI